LLEAVEQNWRLNLAMDSYSHDIFCIHKWRKFLPDCDFQELLRMLPGGTEENHGDLQFVWPVWNPDTRCPQYKTGLATKCRFSVTFLLKHFEMLPFI
jgi:hypothetical protein